MNKGTIICTDEFMQTQMAIEMLKEIVTILSIQEIPLFDGIYQHKIEAQSTLFDDDNSLWECTFKFDGDDDSITPILRKYAERK